MVLRTEHSFLSCHWVYVHQTLGVAALTDERVRMLPRGQFLGGLVKALERRLGRAIPTYPTPNLWTQLMVRMDENQLSAHRRQPLSCRSRQSPMSLWHGHDVAVISLGRFSSRPRHMYSLRRYPVIIMASFRPKPFRW